MKAKQKLTTGTRGRTFKGTVIKKFPKRVVIEFERTIYIKKYERYSKRKTKLHARLPEDMVKDIGIGDYIEIMECRPLSKIIHFIVVGKAVKENAPAGVPPEGTEGKK
ncbi:30S ribosomal protein S17 [archaeon]|jgi:small subunit ribosomal protein S17|nr:30S ribosomal protein S17 [archaeon]